MLNRFHIRRAARALYSGGVIAYPTEGVWGLGCDPFDAEAVARVCKLKRRDPGKGLILIAATIEQVTPWLADLSASELHTVRAGWPGPLTWLVPHGGRTPDWITGGSNVVAVRVSAHPIVSALCREFGGPIVSTSANPSGCQPARTALQVRRYFAEQLDNILPGALGGQRGPTPIRDLRSGQLLRAG
jgi:L-threonylcarbamoyladenylate synthase